MATGTKVVGGSQAGYDGVVPGKIWRAGLIAVVGSVAANLIARPLVMAATGVTEAFLPFGAGPIAFLTAVPVVIGVILFALLARFTRRPATIFTIVAAVALAVSCVPNVLFALDPASTPVPAASTVGFLGLIIFHIIPALVTVFALTRLTRA